MGEKIVCTVEKTENGEIIIGGTDKEKCREMFRQISRGTDDKD